MAPARTTIAAANASNVTMDWLTAAALVALGGGLYWRFRDDILAADFHAGGFNPLILFLLIFVLIGLRYAAKAALGTLRLRKYGSSWLDADPLVPGQPFTALLRTAADLKAPDEFAFNLRCIKTVVSGGPADHSRHKQSIRWEKTVHVKTNGLRSSQGIPVTIGVPADVPVTTVPEGGPLTEGIRWALIVRAARPGLDYEATFGMRAITEGDASEFEA